MVDADDISRFSLFTESAHDAFINGSGDPSQVRTSTRMLIRTCVCVRVRVHAR